MHHVIWRRKRIRNKTSLFIETETHDGHPTSVVLHTRSDVLRWIEVVADYYDHRTPRCRPDLSLQRLDENTRFWVVYSPFRFLHTLEITLTSPLIGEVMTVSEVGNLGRHLAWIPLRRLKLRVQAVDPLFNGVIQWPRLPTITGITLQFTRWGPPNEWKRPFFPHVFRPFPNLGTIDLQVERLGARRSPLVNPHPLFTSYSKGFPHLPRQPGETSAMSLKRVAANISNICLSLGQISWSERRHERTGWVTEALLFHWNPSSRVWE